MWIFVYIVINEFYILCRIFYLLSYVLEIFFSYLILLLCLELIFFRVFGLISIFILTLFSWVWFFGWNFYFFLKNYCTWQIKYLYFFGEKSKLQPMFSSLGNNKILSGMLYINLLNLVWFWSKIWGFYKFWSFKSWGWS